MQSDDVTLLDAGKEKLLKVVAQSIPVYSICVQSAKQGKKIRKYSG
jgi:hypothetical protein